MKKSTATAPNITVKSSPLGVTMKGTVLKTAASQWKACWFLSDSGQLYNLNTALKTFRVIDRQELERCLEACELNGLKKLGIVSAKEITEAKKRAVETAKRRKHTTHVNDFLLAGAALGLSSAKVKALLKTKG